MTGLLPFPRDIPWHQYGKMGQMYSIGNNVAMKLYHVTQSNVFASTARNKNTSFVQLMNALCHRVFGYCFIAGCDFLFTSYPEPLPCTSIDVGHVWSGCLREKKMKELLKANTCTQANRIEARVCLVDVYSTQKGFNDAWLACLHKWQENIS